MHQTTLDELGTRIDTLMAHGGRRILGLAGAPGSGKSTLARQLAQRFSPHSVIVPMDGFHLANCELARLGRSGRKGAEDTFDSAGYVALLQRIRDRPSEIVYAPDFRREIEEAVAGAIAVLPKHHLVITEGNYLLLGTGNWSTVPSILDQTWYVDVDQTLRVERLIARHVAFGRDERAAREWVAVTDEPNAVLIAAQRSSADFTVRLPAR